ncbi:MAG: hypothetical protein M1828_005330 [Chrysothrix sp. TS-e1954]|nr:MAG: hypothetical protein M1828_005330 [Chrysothrix sp. TS-e1954]
MDPITSPLLRLPREIRDMIYVHTLSPGSPVALVSQVAEKEWMENYTNNKIPRFPRHSAEFLGSPIVSAETFEYLKQADLEAHGTIHDHLLESWYALAQTSLRSREPANGAIVRACRQTYEETVLLLYSGRHVTFKCLDVQVEAFLKRFRPEISRLFGGVTIARRVFDGQSPFYWTPELMKLPCTVLHCMSVRVVNLKMHADPYALGMDLNRHDRISQATGRAPRSVQIEFWREHRRLKIDSGPNRRRNTAMSCFLAALIRGRLDELHLHFEHDYSMVKEWQAFRVIAENMNLNFNPLIREAIADTQAVAWIRPTCIRQQTTPFFVEQEPTSSGRTYKITWRPGGWTPTLTPVADI